MRLIAIALVTLLAGCAEMGHDLDGSRAAADRKAFYEASAKYAAAKAKADDFSKQFCALTPTQRNASIAAAWQQERDKPGSPYSSYGDLYVETHMLAGC
jgi:hypothetical protein